MYTACAESTNYVINLKHTYMNQLKRIDGSVIMEFDGELRHQNLRGANLRGADLRWANLSRADLSRANLREADLRSADLIGANLIGADLRGADLRGADLRGAVKVPMFCKWPHGITDGLVHIGCEKRSVEDWDKFFASDDVIKTPRDTPEFKQIRAVYEAYKAYLNVINS